MNHLPYCDTVDAINPDGSTELRLENGPYVARSLIRWDVECNNRQHTGYPYPEAVERVYDIERQEFVPQERIYLDHHPKKGEWEKLKTMEDWRASSLVTRTEFVK